MQGQARSRPGMPACDNQEEDVWKKLHFKRDVPDHQGGRRRKKLKLDEESQKKDNPRHEGLKKRKMRIETEFERECKRLRPEFDYDRELLFINNSTADDRPKEFPAVQSNKPTKLFQIFQTSTVPESNLKPKISKPKKMKQKKSLIHSAAPKIQDIRTFFNPSRDYEASKLPFYPAVQLPII